jgi:AsmA protein
MPKAVKISLIAVAALLALLLAGAAILAATFDPNDYKPQLIRLVQQKTQRTLTIPGEIGLSFFPKLGIELGKASLSERNGNAEFASVDSAQVSLALLPLLAKKYVVDRVHIDGLRATIRRDKDGSTNYDDLLGQEPKAGEQASSEPQPEDAQPIAFDIDSIDIGNARLVYDDRQQGRTLEVTNLNLDAGKVANRTPGKLQASADIKGNRPAINAHIALKSGFMLDLDEKQYVIDDLDAQINGGLFGFDDLAVKLAGDADLRPQARRIALDGIRFSAAGKRAAQSIDVKFDVPKLAITDTQVSGGKFAGEAKLVEGARTVNAVFSATSFEGTPQAFRLPVLVIDATVRNATLDAKAKLSGALSGDIDKMLFSSPQLALTLSGKQGATALNGSLTTPLMANLDTQQIELPKLAADFTLPNPGGGTLTLKAGGHARADLTKQNAAAALKGSLDQSAFDARLGLSNFSPVATTFDIGIDRLDLDRYKAKPGSGGQPAPAPKQTAGQAQGGVEKPIDLSALNTLRAQGSVRIGALKAANISSTKVRVDLRAAGGRLDLNPLSANLYGGSTNGALSVTAGQTPRIAVKQTLSGIDIAPLLRDALGNARLEGRGNVQLDVAGNGATFDQIKKTLDGSAQLTLRDGAIRGINIAQAVRTAKAKIGELRGRQVGGAGAQQGGTASANEKTDFSELTASFRIVDGIAHNDDLSIKSPLLRIGGAGQINLGAERLDYLAKTTVVSTLRGQGGPELESLKGLTVPVRLAGPFSALDWRIDFAGLATELARQRLDEKKEEVRAQAGKALEEQRGKVQRRLEEQLKGILGK